MKKIVSKFYAWCHDPSPEARFTRTIGEGVIGVVTAFISSIAGAPEWFTALVAPTVMVILTAAGSEIAKGQNEND